jgi:HEAT repeat protein
MAAKKNGAVGESDKWLRITALISKISCGDAEECREDARTQLLAIGSPAVPELLEALRAEKGAARVEIAKLLGQLAEPSTAGALVELLSDDDFDVRWEAIEGLSAIGYDGLEPLVSAIIRNPGSIKLRNGAHHVLHHIASEGYYTLLKPLMMALEGAIPNVEVPAAARKIQNELVRD